MVKKFNIKSGGIEVDEWTLDFLVPVTDVPTIRCLYSSKIKSKPRQLRLAVYMLLTSSVLFTTSKQCFEQPAARFLVCSLIFIEYYLKNVARKKFSSLMLLGV